MKQQEKYPFLKRINVGMIFLTKIMSKLLSVLLAPKRKTFLLMKLLEPSAITNSQKMQEKYFTNQLHNITN
ncbi:MAG: hypothetical protein CMG78_12180 [Marinobacter sp.]|nr:hypothetical protein [Marinobacter sp.]